MPPRSMPRPQHSNRPDEHNRPGFAHEKTLVLGVIQLLSGVASIILATVTIAAMAWGYVIGTGIWSGIFFIISGIVGIMSSKKKDNCTIISFMVLSIISAAISAVLCAVSIAGLYKDHSNADSPKENIVQVMVVHSLVLLIGLIEGICAVVSAVLCCRAVCCGVYEAYQLGRQMPPSSNNAQTFQNRLSGVGDQQPIALITPTSSAQQSGLFSFHGAYIIQPAEVGNQQVMYMLPAPGMPGSIPVHPVPPPPYSSVDVIDSDSTAPATTCSQPNDSNPENNSNRASMTSAPVPCTQSQTLPRLPSQMYSTATSVPELQGPEPQPRPTSRHIATSTSSSIGRNLNNNQELVTISSGVLSDANSELELENNVRNRSESLNSSPRPGGDVTQRIVEVDLESEEDKP